MKVLGYDQFSGHFVTEFEFPPSKLSRSTRLVQDFDFDSFQFFRLAIFLDSLIPTELPEDLDLETITLGNVYDFYAVQAATTDLP
jgi:hypothetical protein